MTLRPHCGRRNDGKTVNLKVKGNMSKVRFRITDPGHRLDRHWRSVVWGAMATGWALFFWLTHPDQVFYALHGFGYSGPEKYSWWRWTYAHDSAATLIIMAVLAVDLALLVSQPRIWSRLAKAFRWLVNWSERQPGRFCGAVLVLFAGMVLLAVNVDTVANAIAQSLRRLL